MIITKKKNILTEAVTGPEEFIISVDGEACKLCGRSSICGMIKMKHYQRPLSKSLGRPLSAESEDNT